MKTKIIFLSLGILSIVFVGFYLHYQNNIYNANVSNNNRDVSNACLYGEQNNSKILANNTENSVFNNKRVLLFGDSQVAGPPGRVLQNFVVSEGSSYFYRVGHSGWGVGRWYGIRHQLAAAIQTHRPDVILIILGGNDWSRSGNPRYNLLVQDFWEFLNTHSESSPDHNTKICWIGPPRAVGARGEAIQPNREAISNIIERTIGEDYFINSSDITGTFGRSGDGIHFTYSGARVWIRLLNNRIERCVSRQQ